jgi:NADH-quinone oxidoreductase subunit L
VIGSVLPGHPENYFHNWLAPMFAEIPGLTEPSVVTEWVLIAISVTVVVISVLTALRFYLLRPDLPQKIQQKIPSLHNLVSNKYFVDECYQSKIIDPTVEISRNLWAYVDAGFIDKFTYGAAGLFKRAYEGVKSAQNGNIQQYGMYILVGIVAVLLIIMGS